MDSVIVDTVFVTATEVGMFSSQFMPLLIAFAAVIVSPVVHWMTARRQTILPMNLKWIEMLRDAVIEFIDKASAHHLREIGLYDNASEHETQPVVDMLRLQANIELLLTPDMEDHARLERCIERVFELLAAGDLKTADLQDGLGEVKTCARNILGGAWNRIDRWKN